MLVDSGRRRVERVAGAARTWSVRLGHRRADTLFGTARILSVFVVLDCQRLTSLA